MSRSRPRPTSAVATRRGFSLAELLLAVFILAIGLISIGALFPAAIYQQRLSTDDLIGPVVAEDAFATLEAKLRPEMFGTPEGMVNFFGVGSLPAGVQPNGGFPPGVASVGDWVIQPGDFEWRRPAFFLNDGGSVVPIGTSSTVTVPRGSIAIFRNASLNTWGPNVTASEIPWNPDVVGVNPDGDPQVPFGTPAMLLAWGNSPQPIIFRPEERAYPQVSAGAIGLPSGTAARSTYRWEVMFRRFQGRLLAAVFVFRIGRPGGEAAEFQPAANAPPLDPGLPPFPVRVQAPVPFDLVPPSFELSTFAPWFPGGPDMDLTTTKDNAKVEGTESGSPFDATDPRYGWQATGQWLLDQNNTVHRVLRGRSAGSDDWVLLSRPVAQTVNSWSFIYRKPAGTDPEDIPVLGAWFLPQRDANGNSITPIYVAVKELF